MQIIDLTPDYIRHIIKNKDNDAYENCHPELFAHYYKYWSKKQESDVVNESVIGTGRALVQSLLPQIEKNFAAHDLDIARMKLILFVGQGTTNGHAFKHDGEFVVWIPVETYCNEIDTTVFITHEIVHAVHYRQTPFFYFDNIGEKQSVARQLITEGLATYCTTVVARISREKALWGDYLDAQAVEKWMQTCAQEIESIKKLAKENFTATEHQLGLFYANDPDDIMNYRAGYYLGLLLVEQIAEKYKLSLNDLLCLPRASFEQYAIELL